MRRRTEWLKREDRCFNGSCLFTEFLKAAEGEIVQVLFSENHQFGLWIPKPGNRSAPVVPVLELPLLGASCSGAVRNEAWAAAARSDPVT